MLTPGINALCAETRHEVSWAVVAFGSPSDCAEVRKKHLNDSVTYCHATDGVRNLYAVSSTPYAVFMGPDGTLLAAGLVNHIEHLESMLAVEPLIPETEFVADQLPGPSVTEALDLSSVSHFE